MALEVNIFACIKQACTKLIINELTGVYNDPLNLTGYGTPNPTVADADSTTIEITRPDGTVVIITNPIGLPTSDTSLEYEISASTINSSWTKILDGLYIITYSVVVGSDTYSITKYFLFTCNIECCIAKLFAKIATDSDCSCDSVTIKNALYADALLQGLLGAKACGNITAINNLLTKLNKICTASSSNCGCS